MHCRASFLNTWRKVKAADSVYVDHLGPGADLFESLLHRPSPNATPVYQNNFFGGPHLVELSAQKCVFRLFVAALK